MMEAQRRSSETIVAMGMEGALAQRWTSLNNRYIAAVGCLSDVAGSFGSVSKVLRLLMQSVISRSALISSSVRSWPPVP